MKRYLLIVLIFAFLGSNLKSQVTPHPVVMASGNNASVFGANGLLGNDNGVDYYLHWDGSNIYFGFDGGTTLWWSDLYTVGIDIINDSGCTDDISNVYADSNVFDYYVVFENNGEAYGPSGDGMILFKSNSAGVSWTNIHEVRPANNSSDGFIYWGNPGEVRLKIAWSLLGVTPGANQSIALTYWMNNPNANNVWSSFPSLNPTGSTPVTMTHKLVFGSTGSGVDPSSDGNVEVMGFVLPIELISFGAVAEDVNVELDWTTATERNSSHFEIEHSINGALFESIGRVESAGESSVLQHYEFEHIDPVSGNNYYRLAHYDLDGTLSYSDIESVYFGKGKSISIFPNPVKGGFTISTSEDYNIESYSVFDMQGGLVEQQSVIQYRNNIEVETVEWRNGVYQVLVVYSDGTTAVKNIIKQ